MEYLVFAVTELRKILVGVEMGCLEHQKRRVQVVSIIGQYWHPHLWSWRPCPSSKSWIRHYKGICRYKKISLQNIQKQVDGPT